MAAGQRLFASSRVTRGAMLIIFLELGVSLVWLFSSEAGRGVLAQWLIATPSSVWREGKVWTLVTSAFFEPRFLALVLALVMLWSLIPTLERFWGTPRLLRFALVTTVAGVVAGTLVGLALGQETAVVGLDPFIYSSVVAFGTIYRTQRVHLFGMVQMTGRQLMFGFLGVATAVVVLQGLWPMGGAFVGAILVTVVLLSKRWSPSILWKRWRLQRMRRHLKVVRDEPEKWLN